MLRDIDPPRGSRRRPWPTRTSGSAGTSTSDSGACRSPACGTSPPGTSWPSSSPTRSIIVGMWVRHGGLAPARHTPAGIATAIGQVTALLGTYLALVQLVLMSRSPWLERVLGTDRLVVWHRWTGFACLWLLVGHAVFTTLGFAHERRQRRRERDRRRCCSPIPGCSWPRSAWGCLIVVGGHLDPRGRRRLSYETWFGIHLYAYLGIALAFLHELVVGTDFVDDQVAVGYWVALYVVAIGLLVTFRVLQPIAFSMRHRLRVERRRPGGAGHRLHLHHRAGPGPAGHPRRPVLPGPVPDRWRLVAPPSVLHLGGAQRHLPPAHGQGPGRRHRDAWHASRPGTRIFAEGPYGAFTRERDAAVQGAVHRRAASASRPCGRCWRSGRRVAMTVTLLYRASSWDDVVFGHGAGGAGTPAGHRGAVPRRPPGQPRDARGPARRRSWLRTSCPTSATATSSTAAPGPSWTGRRQPAHPQGAPETQIHAERFS